MASKDEKAKKRKRDAIEASAKTKRQRGEKDGKKAGKGARRGDAALTNGKAGDGAKTLEVSDGPRQLEITREFGDGEDGWRMSKPMGGRMLDIDPILTADEKHLILAYNTSVQIYSTSDSLLVRRIPIIDVDDAVATSIVAMKLSVQDPNLLWVASGAGKVYQVNWSAPSKSIPSFETASRTAADFVVLCSSPSSSTESLLVLEQTKDHSVELNAYQGVTTSPLSKNVIRIKESGQGLRLLAAEVYGQTVVGAMSDRLFITTLNSHQWEELDQAQIETFSFKTPDLIASLAVRSRSRPDVKDDSQSSYLGSATIVDVLVGGARGPIYHYADILARLHAPTKSKGSKGEGLLARQHHWHRKAVHALKWSKDGNYMISGGSENTLVVWQMDSNKMDFLPHLSASVENIIVSTKGSSYVVHLDDNSTMVLSTAELEPTAYVSGIQTSTRATSMPKDLLVQRIGSASNAVRRPIPAAIHPTNSSLLNICVGHAQQTTADGERSAPLLQTFDLDSFTNVTKQPLTRTHTTDINATRSGMFISEPSLSHVAFSRDGNWLASVDEWKPQLGDETVSGDLKEHFAKNRLEVYLKFWEVQGDGTLGLVSRVNCPHASSFPEKVLGLAASPVASCFATIGADSKLRLWTPRTQKQGSAVSKGLAPERTVWNCSKTIVLGDAGSDDLMVEADGPSTVAPSSPPKGCLEFSEDGSTLFAAYGTPENGVVHVVDVASGDVIDSMEGLWKGELRAIGVTSPYLVVLSEELRVYDIVSDELRSAIKVPKVNKTNDGRNLVSLAVDHSTGHFAVSLPYEDASSIGVFDPEASQPLLVRKIPSRIVTLLASPSSSGFVAIDDAAQIFVVAEPSNPGSIFAAQPLDDLRLQEGEVEVNGVSNDLSMILDDDGAVSGDEGGQEPEDIIMGDDVDDDNRPRLIPQHLLTDIFEAAPNYQAATVEDLFYKVAALTQQSR